MVGTMGEDLYKKFTIEKRQCNKCYNGNVHSLCPNEGLIYRLLRERMAPYISLFLSLGQSPKVPLGSP